MRIVVIGGVAAGMSAAARAKRLSPDAEVVVLERLSRISYGACGLPYVLGGRVRGFGELVSRTPQEMREEGVDVRVRHAALSIDPSARTVEVRDEAANRTFREPYDRLLIATGASPVRPGWAAPGIGGVHVLRTLDDGEAIAADLPGARRAVVVGGGYIGLELCEALRRRHLPVVLVEQGDAVAGEGLDEPAQDAARREAERHGVDVRLRTAVTGLDAASGRVRAVHTDAGEIEADLVLVAVGVKPNAALAEAAGVRLGESGAIPTDERLETNLPGVHAAGDVTEVRHLVSGASVHLPLGDTANKQGRVAASVLTGGPEVFRGVVGTSVFGVFGLAVARTGLSLEQARGAGLDAVHVDIDAKDRAGYDPDARPLSVRLIAERGGGRLLGGQLLGHGDAVKRVDTLAAALHLGGTVRDLADFDLAYAPTFSPVWDPVLVAANELLKEL